MGMIYKRLYSALLAGEKAALVTTLAGSGSQKNLLTGREAEELSLPSPLPRDSLILRREPDSLVVENFTPRARLVVFGGGHIALAVAPLARALDFDLVVYDDRPAFCSPARFPQARETVCQSFLDVGRHLKVRAGDYVVIATRGHRHDEDCLRFVLAGTDPFYKGMIGSKRRVGIVRKEMLREGFPPERLETLRSPIGLSIGAVTPAEIAVSILAEIVQARRRAERDKGRGSVEAFPDMDLLRFLASERREGCSLVTVVETRGSTPRKSGAQMAVFFDNRSVGSIGGGCAEAGVMGVARSVIGTGKWCLERVDLTDSAEEDGMVCGGWMEILIDDLPPSAGRTDGESKSA
ncbi:MAG: XdhC family protein [Deltaproteobacteria bacterium]|nr:XdhC family protein [Deltaproteobacteria bacterium]